MRSADLQQRCYCSPSTLNSHPNANTKFSGEDEEKRNALPESATKRGLRRGESDSVNRIVFLALSRVESDRNGILSSLKSQSRSVSKLVRKSPARQRWRIAVPAAIPFNEPPEITSEETGKFRSFDDYRRSFSPHFGATAFPFPSFPAPASGSSYLRQSSGGSMS